MSDAMRQLLSLQVTGEYVFHGTARDLSEFIPQQAYNDDGQGRVPDGAPAVFASSDPHYAVFMAIINKVNCSRGYRCGAREVDGELTFSASEDTLKQLTTTTGGWVYVFPKKAFQSRHGGGVEYVSYLPVKSIERIRVTMIDLPVVLVRE